MTRLDEWTVEREYIQFHMPIKISFSVGSPSDEWLRREVRGQAQERPPLQSVIVQGTREADRLMNGMAQLKHQRLKPYGGSTSQRLDV